MNLKKKIGSAILAGVMTLSLAVPAFASGISDADRLAVTKATEFEIEMEGEVYTPVIRVQVLSKGAKVYLNPSAGKISGEVSGFSEGNTAVPVKYAFDGLGVASTPIMIRSDSDEKLAVNANVTVTAPKTVTISETSVSSETTKKVYIQVAGGALASKAAAASMTDSAFTAVSASKNGVIKESGKAQAVANVVEIPAAKQSDGSIVPQYAGVMLTGSCTASSKLATGSWTEADALSATVILTFTGAT